MLAELVEAEMRKRKLSARGFARETNVSHTTIIRLLDGHRIDVETIQRICEYLNVKVADVISSEYGIHNDARLAGQIATLVDRSPALAAVFRDAFEAMDKGIFSLEDVQEIVNFAAYKMNSSKQEKLRKDKKAVEPNIS